jgi:hypothetical protein
MPITIDGTGTISGISAGGLPDSSITNADLATDAVSTSKILNGAVTTAKMGSAEQSGLAKAWVNFNGQGTVAIRASYNVSSITDNGTGDYTVNFTTAMVDANYSAVVTSGGFVTTDRTILGSAYSLSTSSVKANTAVCTNAAYYDATIVSVAIFR